MPMAIKAAPSKNRPIRLPMITDHSGVTKQEITRPKTRKIARLMAYIISAAKYFPSTMGSSFTGVEHRIEPVRVLDGVTYYNDSIGTSPTRTIAGLRSFDQKVILIAGGYDKHIPYEPLAPEITAHVKDLVLMGATGPRIEKAVREDPNFNEAELPIRHADNMQHAVELARACAKPGDIIILSPASASFDLYPNFEVRGREFKKIVNALK